MIRGESTTNSKYKVSPASSAKLHQVQVEQTMRTIPLLLLFHSIAAGAIHILAGEIVDPIIRGIWPLLCSFVALGFGGLYLSWYRGALKHQASTAQGLIELLGLFLGFVWAMPAAAYALHSNGGPILPLIAMSLTIMGVASISLLRAPIAIIVFLCLMTAALARSAFIALGDYSVLAAAMVVMYGAVLLALTLSSHSHFREYTLSSLQLQQQRDFLALALNSLEEESQDWLWETDREGRLVYASPRLMAYLGLSEESMSEGTFRGKLSSLVDAASWPMLEHVLTTEEDFKPLQIKSKSASGDCVWLLSGKALSNEDGFFAGYRGAGRDVTSQLAADRKIAESMLIAEAAGAAKSRFLSVISHELRTPIHSIVGFAELLIKERDVALNDKARREFTGSILEQARVLQSLINDMLDATRLERGSVKMIEQDMDAAELVELAINACSEQAERLSIGIAASLLDDVDVTGDTARLKQAVINILSNAIKFSVEGGVVHVEMRKTKDNALEIEVRDAGMGIASEDLERLFEPFAQVDDNLTRRFNGLGLGLVIARKIMLLHDGSLKLHSGHGAGTTAVLKLPASRIMWRMARPESSAATA
jgi:PAS domain S-box-containing protein